MPNKIFHVGPNHPYMEAFSSTLQIANFIDEDNEHYLFVPNSKVIETHNWQSKAQCFFIDLGIFASEFLKIVANEKPKAIIFHSLFYQHSLEILKVISGSLPTGWVIWGGDLYSNLSSQDGANHLQRVNDSLSCILSYKGDYDIFSHFVNNAKPYIPNSELLYPIPTIGGIKFKAKRGKSEPYLIVGNSGDASNNHIEILENLCEKKDIKQFKLLIPVSYNSDTSNISNIKNLMAQKNLNATLLTEFMPQKEYAELLQNSFAVITAHNRQQSAGTLITCAVNNVPVILRKSIKINNLDFTNPLWSSLNDYQVCAIDWEEFKGAQSIEESLKGKQSNRLGSELLYMNQTYGGSAERIIKATAYLI